MTTYAYDALNRVKTRTYTNEPAGSETPDVSYYYDLLTNAKGKLIKVTNGMGANLSTTEYVSFDILGRVTRSIQTTDGITYGGGTDQTKWMTYAYNLSGALTEQQYPSGRVVKNVLDNDGELANVQSRKNESHTLWNYANYFSYNAAGAVTSMQLGNGRWESTQFNPTLQPTQIALGSVQNGTDKLKLDYEYGALDLGTGQTIAGTNNGNVAKQTISVQAVGATPGFVATQYYAYDPLNRIDPATENVLPDGQALELAWRQQFKYDRYGNRNFVTTGATATTTLGACPAEVCNPAISPNNNKVASTGYSFDAAGNTTRDAQGRKFGYDAENKQTKVETLVKVNGNDVVTGTVGEYWYDGDGRRIKKRGYVDNQLTEETIFVYDAGGKLVGEYSNQVASSQDAEVAYVTNDHLGSPRINSDVNGNVTTRHDYQPFGEEIATKRMLALGYTDDTVRKQFTGYERDTETELDFAQARMYKRAHGRFTAVDPLLASGMPGNPQTWNRYTYVLNNPLLWIDPTGLIWGKNDDGQVRWFDKKLGKGFSEFTPDAWQYEGTNGRIIQLDANSSNWNYIDPVQVVAESNAVQDLVQSTGGALDDSLTGLQIGARNAATNGINALTNPLGPAGAAAGVPNPLAIAPLEPGNARQAAYAFIGETGVIVMASAGVGAAAAGPASAGSSLSVVPEAQQMSRGAQIVTEWLGPGAKPVRSGSDLMIQSADKTRTIDSI